MTKVGDSILRGIKGAIEMTTPIDELNIKDKSLEEEPIPDNMLPLVQKWFKTGLLRNLEDGEIDPMCFCLEQTTRWMLKNLPSEDLTSDLSITSILLPVVRRVFGDIDYDISLEQGDPTELLTYVKPPADLESFHNLDAEVEYCHALADALVSEFIKLRKEMIDADLIPEDSLLTIGSKGPLCFEEKDDKWHFYTHIAPNVCVKL